VAIFHFCEHSHPVRIMQNTDEVESVISKPVQRGHVDEGVEIMTKKKSTRSKKESGWLKDYVKK